MSHNKNQMKKTCFSTGDKGDRILVRQAETAAGEAAFIADEIRNLMRWSGYKPSDFAILYRSSWVSRTIEEALTKAKIPYEVIGGFAFYERMVIKDSLALLTLAVNPAEDLSAKRIFSKLPGVGKSTIDKIEQDANSRNISFLEAARDFVQKGKRTKARDAIEAFLIKWDQIMMNLPHLRITDVLRQGWEAINYQEYVKKESESEETYRDNVNNLRELWRLAREWELKPSENTLAEFLEHIALVSQSDHEEGGDKVKLQTLHSSKGLEFPVVFIVAMEEGIFPGRSVLTEEQMEEERRLAYVGMTRAKHLLYLTCARQRPYFNDIMYNRRSRFIDEIPEEFKMEV